MRSEVVAGVHIPLHPDWGPGHYGDAGLFRGFVFRGDDGPESKPREWPKISRPEVLLSDDRDR